MDWRTWPPIVNRVRDNRYHSGYGNDAHHRNGNGYKLQASPMVGRISRQAGCPLQRAAFRSYPRSGFRRYDPRSSLPVCEGNGRESLLSNG